MTGEAMRRPLVAGNWKMNGLSAHLAELQALAATTPDSRAEIVICPPATLIAQAVGLLGDTAIAIGGQDCHHRRTGAHTGDIAAEMLSDAGARLCIVGHSERRADHGDDDARVCAKARAALGAGLVPIICVGEGLDDRRAGRAITIVADQLARSLPDTDETYIIAYEPIWAIGTGRVAGVDDVAAMHQAIRGHLAARNQSLANRTRLLYGGSVKPDNAAALAAVADVDGFLVGGASLKAESFAAIVAVYA